jgi:lipopolysaccharide cholinephosphotransferase
MIDDNNKSLGYIHNEGLTILDEIHKICSENNISYFLDSGTALGAIRHNGFIPWDDDIDIGMLRDDYERFVQIAKTKLNTDFYLHSYETDPNFPKFYIKIRKNGTIMHENGDECYNHQGLWVDIFPFDNVSNIHCIALFEIKVGRILRRLYFNRIKETKCLSPKSRLLHYLICWIPKSWLRHLFESFCLLHNASKTRHLTCFAYKMARNMDLLFSRTDFDFFPLHKFEDRTYTIMNGYNNYLKIMYGNYMELPPEKERIGHIADTSL